MPVPRPPETRATAADRLLPLPPDALRWRCNPQDLTFESTAALEPLDGVIGQDDAVESLRFGLETSAPGQNIFVRGLTGTGRMTLLKRLMEEIRPNCPRSSDRCFVQNFSQPDRPRLITLPRGRAAAFRDHLDRLIAFIRGELRPALASERIKARRAALDQSAEQELEALMGPFNEALATAGLTMMTIQAGPIVHPVILPLWEGKPLPPEAFEQLRADGRMDQNTADALRRKQAEFSKQLLELGEQIGDLRRKHDQGRRALIADEARGLLDRAAAGVLKEFDSKDVAAFLKDVLDDVIREHGVDEEPDPEFLERYRVNVVLSHGSDGGCPIVLENTPTVQNLLGNIDYEFNAEGHARASHLGIRAGSILRADGGFLVLEARDVLAEPGAWRVLIRTLRTGTLEIVPQERGAFAPGPSLKPEAIDVHVKVILLGDADLYYLLDVHEPDFGQLFKVLADFDATIPRTDRAIIEYGRVLARIAREEQLLPFGRSAVALLVEHGARIAARRDRLTARFGRLADLAREAGFVAHKERATCVTSTHVQQAITQRKRRSDLPARRFRALIADGTIRIMTSGVAVGQINGLAVLHAGPLTYGFPARITATIGPGTAGVINIEREAQLSGAIHTKGFYILGGLLRWLLRTDHPLAFDASIAFEQSYGGIDGDSASAAEICCLLSALTDVPLRQDLAMTGAIDQVGHIQPVGAVNEKVEGFFDACADAGLTGTQGVIIPLANAGDLMLREDVLEACRADRFHVFAVDRVHEALSLFTGIPAGSRGPDGSYPTEALLGRASRRAREYWAQAVEGHWRSP